MTAGFVWPSAHELTARALAREKDEFEAQEDVGREDDAYQAEVDAAVRELLDAHAAYEDGGE